MRAVANGMFFFAVANSMFFFLRLQSLVFFVPLGKMADSFLEKIEAAYAADGIFWGVSRKEIVERAKVAKAQLRPGDTWPKERFGKFLSRFRRGCARREPLARGWNGRACECNFRQSERLLGTVSIVPAVQKICLGGNHAVFLANGVCAHDVYVLGYNTFGQVGLDPARTRIVDRARRIARNAVDVAAGYSATYYASGGRVYAAGCAQNGRLGVHGTNNGGRCWEFSPTEEFAALRVVGGSTFAVAITADHELYTWGDHRYTGHGLEHDVRAPKRLDVVGRVLRVAIGGFHVVVLSAAGDVWAWGHNRSGQLCFPLDRPPLDSGLRYILPRPRKLDFLAPWSVEDVLAGWGNTVLVCRGKILVAGRNCCGQAAKDPGECPNTPRGVPSSSTLCELVVPSYEVVRRVWVGDTHGFVWTDAGQYVWGGGAVWDIFGCETDPIATPKWRLRRTDHWYGGLNNRICCTVVP